jgi:hypothetical protein
VSITNQSATGALQASQGSTSIDVAYPSPKAAGWIAVLMAAVKESAAVFDAVSGFEFIGSRAGGEGTAGDDVGTTRLAAWYRILDGTESGSVNVTNDVGVSAAGAMSIYAPTDGRRFVTPPVALAGSDDTHAADWNPTGFGTWPSAVAPGDMILSAFSADNDAIQSITSRSLTQTGITFGTPSNNVFRFRSLSDTGFDCGLYLFDWFATAGSNTNEPAYTHVTGTATCGSQLLVRLREEDVAGRTTMLRPAVVAP